MEYIWSKNTKIGDITMAEEEGRIILCHFGFLEEASYQQKETSVLKEAFHQLEEYLEGKRKEFTVPLELRGTEFQKRVWQELRKIPYGQTRTYQEIAVAIGSPKACRAVGNSNHRNPIGIMVPCHRVIGTKGKLVGYAGRAR